MVPAGWRWPSPQCSLRTLAIGNEWVQITLFMCSILYQVIPGREIVRRFFGVYGDTYGFDFFGRQLIFTRDPKVAHSVLNSAEYERKCVLPLLDSYIFSFSFSKVFDESGVVRALVPQSLLLADGVCRSFFPFQFSPPDSALLGNVWQAHRPIVTGMLSNAVVSELLPIVERVVDEFSDKLCATRDPIKVNGRVDIMKLAFEAISVSILGYRSDSFDAFGAVVQSMTNPWRTYVPFYRFLRTKDNLKLEKSISSLKQMPSDFLESQIRTDSQCFNAALSKSVEALGKEATVDNLVSFLFAGHETTSSFLSFALYHIAADETLQNLLLAEAQQSATPLRGGKMFTSFVKEVLRLYPPAPALGRTAVRGTRLPGGEFLFPGVRSYFKSA